MKSRSKRETPPPPWAEEASAAALPKPQFKAKPLMLVNTSGMAQSKTHPVRDQAYRRWLTFLPCSVKGLVDQKTGQAHVCWSPEEWRRSEFKSDPAHSGKAISGRMKRDDSGCIPLCRHSHRLQESNHAAFDERFGIDRYEIAAELYARFLKEQERKRGAR